MIFCMVMFFTVRDLSVFQMTIQTNNDVEGYHYRFVASATFRILCSLALIKKK